MDKLSYALGLGIGQQLAQMGADNISAEDFAQAINDVEIHTQTLLLVGLGPSSEKHAMAELRPVRHQSGLTHSGSLIVQGD